MVKIRPIGDREQINGNKFFENLDRCTTPQEIFDLLHNTETMTDEIIKDRTDKMTDNDLVASLHAQTARFNAQIGNKTSHSDCVEAAANRYMELTGKTVRDFKGEVEKDIQNRNAMALARTVRAYSR